MRTRSFIAAVTAAGLSTLVLTASDALATRITPIQGKYSKIKLDGICAKEGGSSYGTADTAYGCTKGNNTVECNKDGSCTGYTWLKAGPGGRGIAGSPEGILQSPAMMQGVTGGVLSAQ